MKRLGVTLSGLLSFNEFSDGETWRRKAACGLRDLVGADAAFVSLESARPSCLSLGLPASVVAAYQRHYARLDHGIARQRALRLEVWTRRMLWSAPELARSEYYNDFALPNRLHYAAGIVAYTSDASLRVSLLYTSAARRMAPLECVPSLRDHGGRLRLLRLALPAFRVGTMLSLGWQSRREGISDVMDRVTQPLALCSATGELLHENPALTRVAPLHDVVLRAAIQRVAVTAGAYGRFGRLRTDGLHVSASGWRIVGSCVHEHAAAGAGPMILVSLEPCTTSRPSQDMLRTRYALTLREIQVLELLRERRSNAEIAGLLGISAHTARHHTEHVLLKLGVTSRRRVADRYVQLGAEAASVVASRAAPLAPRGV